MKKCCFFILLFFSIGSGQIFGATQLVDATSSPSGESTAQKTYPTFNKQWTWENITTSKLVTSISPNQLTFMPGQFTFRIKKENGKWNIVESSDLDNDDTETISFDPSRQKIGLVFNKLCTDAADGQNVEQGTVCGCPKGVFNLRDSRKKDGYQLCNSNFKTPSLRAAFGTAMMSALTMMFGTAVIYSEIDSKVLLAAAKEANLINAVNKIYYDNYRQSYLKAKDDESALSNFILKYKNIYDPDNLTSEARKELDLRRYHESYKMAHNSRQLQAFIDAYNSYDPDNLIPQAKDALRIAEKQEALEAERRKSETAQEAKEIALWRKNLKSGDDTNCGPIIEIKQPLLKIYLPVKDYGNEHWIKINQIEKPGSGCCFTNGSYAGKSCY